MRHYVRTGHGDSDTYYTGDNGRTLQGGGQGNGAAGPMWVAVSLILLSIMADFDLQSRCIAAISGICLTFSVIMYVDDSGILLMVEENDTYTTILQKTQSLANKCAIPKSVLWLSI